MDVADPDLRSALIAAVQNPNIDATAHLHSSLLDPEVKWSLPYTEKIWAQNKAIADKYGLDLVAYEGGQHVHHSFAVRGLKEEETNALTGFLSEFVRGPEMAQLYDKLWDIWERIGDGPFMQFTDVSAPSKWGSWGLLSALGDRNPRAELLLKRNATAKSWFGDGGGTRYQQGVIALAGDGGEILTGTQKADFLVGGAGDDVIIAGPGRNGINGGAGTDTLVLSGNPDDFTLVPEGDGYRLTGPGIFRFPCKY